MGVAPSVDRGHKRPLICRVDASVVAGEFATVAGIHESREHVGAEIACKLDFFVSGRSKRER